MQKILIVGGGGREAAMAWKLTQNPDTQVFCAPGNAGIEQWAELVSISATDIDRLLAFARKERIDLTIVGPEQPLVDGIVDQFQAEGQLICGPTKKAAMLTEGSKAAFKDLLAASNLPTAPYRVFDSRRRALAYVRERGPVNIVIKADGLMGGKGVFLPNDITEAESALEHLMVPGGPGERVVVEERLYGVERSVIGITDGSMVYTFPFTQDYKRLREGDQGPNTGGMGAHTIELSNVERIELQILLSKVLAALRKRGVLYRGPIYLGIIMTEDGPMILECNCRMGDPETQAILPSIDGDFAALCRAAAEGNLRQVRAPDHIRHAVCVVAVSSAYPDSSDRDDVIKGLDIVARMSDTVVFPAGIKRRGDQFTTGKSGRVLGVTAFDRMFSIAVSRAYSGMAEIHFLGKHVRMDIGAGVG